MAKPKKKKPASRKRATKSPAKKTQAKQTSAAAPSNVNQVAPPLIFRIDGTPILPSGR